MSPRWKRANEALDAEILKVEEPGGKDLKGAIEPKVVLEN
jgi:hypothetical protein